MCGRYSNATTWAEVHAFSRPITFVTPSEEPEPAYNIAPMQQGWVIVAAEGQGGEARRMRWGLVPSWAKDPKIGNSMINARVETASTKPAFRAAWKARRCLVPASGYYEWRTETGVKQPYFIHPTESPLLMFAGLWEHWRAADGGDWLHTYSIITQAAEGELAELHDRAPVMLSSEVLKDWLHGSSEDAGAIVTAAPLPPLNWHRVGRAVGNVRNQGPALIAPVDGPA